VFFCYQNEDDSLPDTTIHHGYYAGYVVVDKSGSSARRFQLDDVPCAVVESELDLINWVVDLVKGWDPDVLAGWELHNSSWGYLASRANEAFGERTNSNAVALLTGCRCRSHGATIASHYGARGAEERLLFGNARIHLQSIWSARPKRLANMQVGVQSDPVHLRERRIPCAAPEVSGTFNMRK